MSPQLGQTPSQTVGPFFSMRLGGKGQNVIATPGGERITVTGRVLDGARLPIEDALLEFWQANPGGRYRHPDDNRPDDNRPDDNPEPAIAPSFTGFARAMTDFESGVWRLETVKPGRLPDSEGALQAPHVSVIVQARGTLNPVFTRIYLSDEDEANRDDLILRQAPRERSHTLIAKLIPGSTPKLYEFDIKFQGDDETVFFDF
ncbi:MAG: protocatechuate 3,4-dioxygenase subunit alpha [Acidimicrobiia bacterium]